MPLPFDIESCYEESERNLNQYVHCFDVEKKATIQCTAFTPNEALNETRLRKTGTMGLSVTFVATSNNVFFQALSVAYSRTIDSSGSI